jgi:hypothetical protein
MSSRTHMTGSQTFDSERAGSRIIKGQEIKHFDQALQVAASVLPTPGQSREMWLATRSASMSKICRCYLPLRAAGVASTLLGLRALLRDMALRRQSACALLPALLKHSRGRSSCSTCCPAHSHGSSGPHHRKSSTSCSRLLRLHQRGHHGHPRTRPSCRFRRPGHCQGTNEQCGRPCRSGSTRRWTSRHRRHRRC